MGTGKNWGEIRGAKKEMRTWKEKEEEESVEMKKSAESRRLKKINKGRDEARPFCLCERFEVVAVTR
jgi:hypothetical protein